MNAALLLLSMLMPSAAFVPPSASPWLGSRAAAATTTMQLFGKKPDSPASKKKPLGQPRRNTAFWDDEADTVSQDQWKNMKEVDQSRENDLATQGAGLCPSSSITHRG
jgi:hypothetical protein